MRPSATTHLQEREGLVFRVSVFGVRIERLAFRVSGLFGFRVCSGFRFVRVSGLFGFRVCSQSGFQVC